MPRSLTHHYLDTFAAIKAFMRQKNYPPTVHELMALTGASEATTYHHFSILISAGLICRKHYVARGIELTGLEPEIVENEPHIRMSSWDKRHLIKSARSKPHRSPAVKIPKLSKAQLEKNIDKVVAKARADQQAAFCDDANVVRLANGVKVIIRKPSLWGSKAHQG